MPIVVNEVQITWGTVDDGLVGFGGNQTSDVFAVHATCFQAQIQLKANNNGTPGSGDTVDFYLLGTLGDPDGAGADEYATTTQGIHLARLDTQAANPAIVVVQIPIPLKGGRIYVVNNSGADTMNVSAIILEQRAS